VDLSRHTAWLNQTINGTPRGVPSNQDALDILIEQVGKHPRHCFTYQGKPIKWELSNSAWHSALEKAGIKDFRFHDLRHTWASWHRKAGTTCDELKESGGWKSRQMVDCYAKYATEHLTVAAARIERVRSEGHDVVNSVTFCHASKRKRPRLSPKSLNFLVGRAGFEPATNGLKVRCSTS
jgi:integrase